MDQQPILRFWFQGSERVSSGKEFNFVVWFLLLNLVFTCHSGFFFRSTIVNGKLRSAIKSNINYYFN